MRRLIPDFIAEKYKQNKTSGSFEAAIMFIDISGFTAMTQELMKTGKEGAEVLSEIINNIFTPAINTIYVHKGFISTFAGDAFTAVFISAGNEDKTENILKAAVKIKKIFNLIGEVSTKFGNFKLSVKIGLSYGTTDWGIIWGSKFSTYFFKGEAIIKSIDAQSAAELNEIICEESIVSNVQKSDELKLTKKEDNHFILSSYEPAGKSGFVSIRENQEDYDNVEQKNFIPQSVFKHKSAGEYRGVISCFVAFNQCEGWQTAVSRIIDSAIDYGGYFNKIDFYSGGAYALILFGAPIAKENLNIRACEFALTIQNPALTSDIPDFKTKIGLTYETVFAGFIGSDKRCEYSVLGMSVNLAARFMVHAQGRDILIDKYLYRNTESNFESRFWHEYLFKGFKDEIPVFRLFAKTSDKSSSMYQGEMVGREEETVLLLEHLFRENNTDFGGVIYIDGIAGIGKSRLVNELKNLPEVQEKYQWLYLPCDEILRKNLNPLVYFLRNYFSQSDQNSERMNKIYFNHKLKQTIGKTDDKIIKSELQRTKSILGALLNLHWENSVYEHLDSEGRYENTLFAVKNLIKAESLIKPVIIEIEDGHWIDPDSKKFLQLFVRNITKFPINIITTSRNNDDGSGFVFDLPDTEEKRIQLKYLSSEQSKNLVFTKISGLYTEALKPEDIPKSTYDIIVEKSDGDPFYIEQIVLYLSENNLISENYTITEKFFKIPSSINTLIISRIDRLNSELKEIVKTASVLGREFAVNILTKMLNNKEIQPYLVEGEKETIWAMVNDLRYIFKHALIRETVYEMQLKQSLRETHLLAAETMEELYTDDLSKVYGELANHFEKAEKEDKIFEYFEKAGDSAKDKYMNELALDYYSRLIFYLTGYDEKVNLHTLVLLKKTNILKLTGEWSKAEESYTEALLLSKDINDEILRAEINIQLGDLYKQKSENDKAEFYLGAAEKIFDKSGNKSGLARVFGMLGKIAFFKGNHNEATKLFEQQLLFAKEAKIDCETAKAYGNIGLVNFHKGNYKDAMKYYRLRLNIANETNDIREVCTTYGDIGIILRNQGDIEGAMQHFEKQQILAEEFGDKRSSANAIGRMGLIFAGQGKYKKAITCHNTHLQIAEELGDNHGISRAKGNIGNLKLYQGDYDGAMGNYLAQLNITQKLEDKRGTSIVLGNIGLIYDLQGNFDKAMEYYKKQLILAEELQDKRSISIAVVNMGNVYRDLEKYEEAMECFDKKLTIAKELNDKIGISIAVGNIGVVHRKTKNFAEAMQCFEEQLTLAKELGDKTGIAVAKGNIGKVFIDYSDNSKALDCFDFQLKIFEELGDKTGISMAKANLGIVYQKTKEFSKALTCFDEAIAIGTELKQNFSLCSYLLNKAKLLQAVNKPHEAEKAAKESLKTAETAKRKKIIIQAKEFLKNSV